MEQNKLISNKSSCLQNSTLLNKIEKPNLLLSISNKSNLTNSLLTSFQNKPQQIELKLDLNLKKKLDLDLTTGSWDTGKKAKINLENNLLTNNTSFGSFNSFLKPSQTHLKAHLTELSVKTNTSLLLTNSLLNKVNQTGHNKPVEINQDETVTLKRKHSIEYEPNENVLINEFIQIDSLINSLNKQAESAHSIKKFKKLSTSLISNPVIVDKTSNLQRYKSILINLVSSSLLSQPNFKTINDTTRLNIMKYASLVTQTDPEFILKLALYTRRELNIRVTANFLISLAGFISDCRPYLSKYFNNSIILPSDWIDIAEQYQLFMDKKINYGALPSALRKCMVDKFPQFDAYQLAKYNKEKSRLAKNSSLKGVKHVRSKLKDDQGNESDIIEDKYIKTITDGLKTNYRILIDIVVNTNCDSFKLDIIQRDTTMKESNRKNVKNKNKTVKINKADSEYEEPFIVRTKLDYELKRILVKSCLNKVWDKRSDVFYPSDENKFEFKRGFDSVQFYIDIELNFFKFGFIDSNQNNKEIVLSSYNLKTRDIQLDKLNILRISGVDIKLKDVKLINKDEINFDYQTSTDETEIEIKQKSFTLKQLIRQLHISKPVTNVMSLLGKKYPESFEEFIQMKLEGEYDSSKSGKRMKLPVPETWETQISMFGNKPEVWQRLIDNKKLPYMAMLRNLRNLIKSGISDNHHTWVIKKLQDEGAVINSKQFPFRFFTAYEVLDDLIEEYKNFTIRNPFNIEVDKLKKSNKKEKTPSDLKYSEELVKRYKTALDNALKVATRYNVSPIKGSTVIFLNLSNQMMTKPSGSARNLSKKVTTLADIASLMGLMLKYACEYSKLNIYRDKSIHKDIQLKQGTILDNMKSLNDLSRINSSTNQINMYPKEAFIEILENREYYDNLVIIGNGIGDVEFHKSFLKKYRAYINKDLLFVSLNLSITQCGLVDNADFTHENDVCISGYSDSVLRFIAERGGNGQLIHIDNIDKSYDLPQIKNENKISLNSTKLVLTKTPKIPKNIISQWKTIKVFISSTFKDMHSERDILTRTVFPLLRAKLASHLINIHEIDMRWGITEHESNTNETLSICLNQILECDYFIGILGDRYGLILDKYKTNLDWVQSYPVRASITELEFEAQIRKCNKNPADLEKTFFYFRNNESFIDSVPNEYRNHFEDENDSESKLKLLKLKQKVKSKSFEVFNNYESKWLKIDSNNRALLTGLDGFAERVFNNLYNSILKNYCQNTNEQTENELTRLNMAYIEAYASLFTGRFKLINKLDKLLKDTTQVIQASVASSQSAVKLIKEHNSIVNFCLCLADAGCGKTTFLSYYYINHLNKLSQFNFAYSVGSFDTSDLVLTFLKCFCVKILNYYKIFQVDDFDSTSSDFNYFKKIFALILDQFNKSELSKSEKFYILIDGVDMFVDENGTIDESFNWLPDLIPSSVVFIFSARRTSSTKLILDRIASSNKQVNAIKLNLFEIEQLDVLDKIEIIRSKLNKFNKKLDESSFNNQMKLLTSKREATNPLYLSLACEELRVHNQFETLTFKLKELPVKTNLLINYVLNRLENEYGNRLVTCLFMFIACSNDGLTQQELFDLIQLYFSLTQNELESLNSCESLLNFKYLNNLTNRKNKVSTVKYLSLLETISDSFLNPRTDKNSLICLKSHSLIETAIRVKYSDKCESTINAYLSLELINKLMALYNWYLIDEKFTKSWSLNNQRGYINLPYHLSYSESFSDLVIVLCDLKFIANKSEFGLVDLLMNDFDLNQIQIQKNLFFKKQMNKSIKNLSINTKKFNDYKEFIMTNFHILISNPSLIYQQAVNENNDSFVASDINKILTSDSNLSGCLFEWKNKMKSNEKTIKPLSLTNFSDSVSSVTINKTGDLIACGTENCEIKLYSLNTANLIKTLQGHSGRVNQLCFANQSTLVSVSSDGLASIWSVRGGYRIKVLNNHNGHVVNGCSAEYSGKQFMTCGWDCNVKIWDTNEGKLLGELKGHPKPVNCIVFNPDGFTVSTGGWDSAIRIFNVVNRNRIAVLRGHKTSIRSISYSFDGVFIASSSIDGDVKLWNSKMGSNVATLKGHSLPVNSIRFSPNNQFLITGSSDRRMRVWSGNVGKIVRIIKDGNSVITSVCFNPKNGEYIAAGYHDGKIKIFETHTSCMKLNIKIHDKPIKRVKFTQCGLYLVSSSEDGSLKIVDVSKPSIFKVVTELKGNTKSVNAFAVNLNNIIITGSEDCLINIYDRIKLSSYRDDDDDDDFNNIISDLLETNTVKPQKIKFDKDIYPKKSLNVHKSAVTSCAFNSLGDKFATASKDANVIIFSLDQYSLEVYELHNISNGHLDWITDLAWSNSSEYILTSSNDFSLKIWNAETGKETTTLTGHKTNINSCSFQYGCGVSTSSDGLVKIWSHKGFEVASLTGHQKRVNSCDLFFKIKEEEILVEENDKSWAEKVDESEWNESHTREQTVKKSLIIDHVYLVTGSDDSTIRIWKPNESDFIMSLETHNNKINSVDLSSNDIIASGSTDQTVNIYNMKEFFNEYTTGKFVNSERLIKNHSSEITSIVFTNKLNLMLSSSRDGLLLIWKCLNDSNLTLKSIDFIQELQAHSRSINKIVIINEKETLIEFATCSDDRLIKIWSLNLSENNQTVLVELIKTIKLSASIVYMFTHLVSDHEFYLASLVADSNRLHLFVYDINKKYAQCRKGFQIVHFNGLVQDVKKTENYLFVTLVHDEIYKLRLDEMFSKMNVYLFDNMDEFRKECVLSELSNNNWFSGIDENENNKTTYTVDYKGRLYCSNKNKLEFKKEIHTDKCNVLFRFKKISDGSTRYVTSSQDCTVKMWTDKFEYQLGQYNTHASITAIELKESTNDKYSFVFGDQFGNLYLVVWHDHDN